MKLEFLNKTVTQIDRSVFEKLLEKGCDVVGCKDEGEIGLNFIDDRGIAELNENYRGVSGPTDVLSFGYLEEEKIPKDECVGEIFISVETAKRQARAGLEQELHVLFVHGFLHIFGFGHDTDDEEKLMNDLADKILAD